jgi:hypothetical protein
MRNKHMDAEPEALTAVNKESTVSWEVTPCNLGVIYRHSSETSALHDVTPGDILYRRLFSDAVSTETIPRHYRTTTSHSIIGQPSII